MEYDFSESVIVGAPYEAIAVAMTVDDIEIVDETLAMPHLFPYLMTFDTSVYQTAGGELDDNWAYNKMQVAIKKARKNNFIRPNKITNECIVSALNCIKDNDAHLNFINPTVEGGVIVEFEKNNINFILEIDNSGEISFLKKAAILEVDDLTQDNFLETLQSAISNA